VNPRDDKLPPAPRSSGEIVHALESALLPEETPGVRIGNYKLLQKLGEGGFGVVWMAEQEEPVRRRVALKVIKPGMDTAEVVARFEAERQALALMEHPNIARVFDAGATDAGRPYFVMELVRGVPITRYCDDNRMPAEARLHLFMSVCQAVQHAHQKGVIHRDLKPSNILVTLHDGVPVPKIIDFGIAKATGGARLTDKTLFTQFHAFIGTPAYTSPEQIEMSGLDVDTRSDIYSLGVLLYELLTGRQPFDADALVKSGLEAMRRTIREIDPPRPSHRLTTLTAEERTTVAQHRSTDAGKLSLLLRGDLDLIVMHCLEKSRTRRYETANGLAMDIGRYLASEPVVARPPSQTYRLQKFVRRHKLAVIAAAAIAASLVAGLVASSVLLVRERTAHAHAVVAEQAESRLRREAEQARELETKRSSRTALDLTGQLLDKGQTADALAYLVYAAQKDPGNALIAPLLVSVLTSHNFLVPEGTPFRCGSRVVAVHYTADGRSIYAGTEDGTFRMIDAASGELKCEIQLGKKVRRAGWAFADKDEAVFAVSFTDKTIGLFAVKSGRPVWPLIQLDEDLFFGSGVQFSPDARWLYATSIGLNCFWVWDAASGKELIRRSFAPHHFWGPDVTKDGTRLAFVYEDKVNVWSLPECKPSFEPVPIKRTFVPDVELSPQFSPDGRILAIVDFQDGVQLFDPANGRSLQPTVRGEFNTRKCTGFLPDGRLSAPGDKSWDLLDVATGIATSQPAAGFSNGGQAFSADGRFIVTASDDGFPRLWETKTGRLFAEATVQQHGAFCVAPSPDGTQVVLGTDAGAILRFRVGRGAARPLVLPPHHSPDIHRPPLFEEGSTRLLWFQEGHAVVLDVASGREVAGGFAYPPADLPELQTPLTIVESRPDRRFFVIQDWAGQRPSKVWENTGAGIRRVGILQGDSGAVAGFGYYRSIFSPKGDLFARKNKGLGEIGVWNLHTGARVGPGCSYLDKHISAYQCMDFSPDGKRLAAGTEEGKVVVWDVATGQVAIVLPMQPDTPCTSVQFSPDGARLLTTDGQAQARLWNAATGEPCSALLSGALHAGFSPDGRSFSTNDDIDIRFWDGKNGTPVGEPSRKPVLKGLVSRNGERIAIAEGDFLRVCDVRSGQVLTGPMRLREIFLADWSPDGRFLQLTAKNDRGIGAIHFLSVPPPLPEGTPIPPWLQQLASIYGAKKINETGQCVDAPEVAAQIGDVRRQLAALRDDAPYVEWGQWILDNSPTRSIAPGFTITPAEADKLEMGPDR
jgi:serine/threonine protein kinase/WD40 repeat protein